MAFFAVCTFWIIGVFQLRILLRKKTGHYEFPFFFTLVSLFYFGSQLIVFSVAEGDRYGSEIALFVMMAIASNFAVHIGFKSALAKARVERVTAATRFRAIFPFLLLCGLTILAYYSFAKLAGMAGGYNQLFRGGGNSIVWEGPAVRYVFAVQNLNFVIPISLFLWRRTNRKAFLLLAIVATLVPIANALLLNRRFVFFLLVATLILFLLFQYRVVFPKLILVIAIPVGMAVITLFPLLRGTMPLSDVFNNNVSVINLIVGQTYGETKNGTLALASCFRSGEYEYGLGFIKQVFKDFVPSSVIGRETKSAILGEDIIRDIVYGDYYYDIPSHEFITGISTGFFQLGIFCIVLWYAIGFAFGRNWYHAYYGGGFRDQILYTAMVPTGLMALYYAPTAALSQAIKIWIIIQLTFLLSRIVYRFEIPAKFRSPKDPMIYRNDVHKSGANDLQF